MIMRINVIIYKTKLLDPISSIQKIVLFKFQRKLPLSLTLRLLMSYIYEAPILDVSRSHTTTQHSR